MAKLDGSSQEWIDKPKGLGDSAWADLAELEEKLGFLSNNHPYALQLWSKKLDEAFIRVIAPDWEGLSCPQGRKAARLLVLASAPAFVGRGKATVDPCCFQELASSVARCSEPGSKIALGARGFEQILRDTLWSYRQTWVRRTWGQSTPSLQDARQAALSNLVISALIDACDPEQRRRVAHTFMKPNELRGPPDRFANFEMLHAVYSKLFDSGCTVNDVLRCETKPGKSIANQVQDRISKMTTGGFFEFFQSAFDRQAISAQDERSDPLGPSIDSKGLAPADLARVLTLVEAIDRDHPGAGAAGAIAWLEKHPSAQKRRAQSQAESTAIKARAATHDSALKHPASRL